MKLRSIIPILLTAALLVGIQLTVTHLQKEFYLVQMIMSAYYAIVVLGLCLVMGYAGQASLGHAAFFAIGGYTSAILTTTNIAAASKASWGIWLQKCGFLVARHDIYGSQILAFSPWAAFVAAILITIAVALVIGYPALRLKGHYLAMATLGFGLIIYRIILGTDIMGRADGITSVPNWELGFGLVVSGSAAHRVQNYYIACGLMLLVLVLLLNIVNSRVGRALRAIHDGETAANAMGINTASFKLQAFVISAVLAAIAGCFLTHYNGAIGPSEATAFKSIRYLALVAAGGMANLWGALTVSSILNYCSLRGLFGSYDHAVFGILLILIVSLTPDGPLKPLRDLFMRLIQSFGGKKEANTHGAA